MTEIPSRFSTALVGRIKVPSRKTIVLVGLLFGLVMWTIERFAEFSWIETRYLYDPATDSVFAIGKTLPMEGLFLRDWVPSTLR